MEVTRSYAIKKQVPGMSVSVMECLVIGVSIHEKGMVWEWMWEVGMFSEGFIGKGGGVATWRKVRR